MALPDLSATDDRERLDHAVELIYDRVDGNYTDLSRGRIRAVLVAAEQEFEMEFNPDTVICLDCRGKGKPSCDRDGHGLATLFDLMANYSQ